MSVLLYKILIPMPNYAGLPGRLQLHKECSVLPEKYNKMPLWIITIHFEAKVQP
jgi:hypothetical protein